MLVLLAVLPAVASAAEVQAWLVFNPNGPETLMSTDVLEKNGLVRNGWHVSGTGVLQTDAQVDAGLLYRMFRPVPKGGVLRMLVATPEEVNENLKAGFITEGALGHVAMKAAPGRVAVYRFRKDGKFIWLISETDQAWATKAGWMRDKAVFWLWPNEIR